MVMRLLMMDVLNVNINVTSCVLNVDWVCVLLAKLVGKLTH